MRTNLTVLALLISGLSLGIAHAEASASQPVPPMTLDDAYPGESQTDLFTKTPFKEVQADVYGRVADCSANRAALELVKLDDKHQVRTVLELGITRGHFAFEKPLLKPARGNVEGAIMTDDESHVTTIQTTTGVEYEQSNKWQKLLGPDKDWSPRTNMASQQMYKEGSSAYLSVSMVYPLEDSVPNPASFARGLFDKAAQLDYPTQDEGTRNFASCAQTLGMNLKDASGYWQRPYTIAREEDIRAKVALPSPEKTLHDLFGDNVRPSDTRPSLAERLQSRGFHVELVRDRTLRVTNPGNLLKPFGVTGNWHMMFYFTEDTKTLQFLGANKVTSDKAEAAHEESMIETFFTNLYGPESAKTDAYDGTTLRRTSDQDYRWYAEHGANERFHRTNSLMTGVDYNDRDGSSTVGFSWFGASDSQRLELDTESR